MERILLTQCDHDEDAKPRAHYSDEECRAELPILIARVIHPRRRYISGAIR